VRTRLGASTDELTAGELADGEHRVISGSVLSGRKAMGEIDGFLGRYHHQISVIRVNYLNPERLHKNPAFSHVVTIESPHRTIYVGGQNAVDDAGAIIGNGDVAAQTKQVCRNLQVALAAAGAGAEHVVKWTVCLVQGQPIHAAFAAAQEALGTLPNPPTLSVLQVAGLAHPDFLVEIDAIAVLP